jgi:hypothetical protein
VLAREVVRERLRTEEVGTFSWDGRGRKARKRKSLQALALDLSNPALFLPFILFPSRFLAFFLTF